MWADEAFKKMLGRKIESVSLNTEKNRVLFVFADGFQQAFAVEGDCCSSSWIEHMETPKDIAGSTLLAIEESGAVDETKNDALNPVGKSEWGEERQYECLKVYHTKFITDRGHIMLEYRNSSNGYYGGYLVAEDSQ